MIECNKELVLDLDPEVVRDASPVNELLEALYASQQLHLQAIGLVSEAIRAYVEKLSVKENAK